MDRFSLAPRILQSRCGGDQGATRCDGDAGPENAGREDGAGQTVCGRCQGAALRPALSGSGPEKSGPPAPDPRRPYTQEIPPLGTAVTPLRSMPAASVPNDSRVPP